MRRLTWLSLIRGSMSIRKMSCCGWYHLPIDSSIHLILIQYWNRSEMVSNACHSGYVVRTHSSLVGVDYLSIVQHVGALLLRVLLVKLWNIQTYRVNVHHVLVLWRAGLVSHVDWGGCWTVADRLLDLGLCNWDNWHILTLFLEEVNGLVGLCFILASVVKTTEVWEVCSSLQFQVI